MTLRALVPTALVNRARHLRRRMAVSRFNERVVEHSYRGRRKRIHLCDPVGAEWYDQDFPHLEELDYLDGFPALGPIRNVFELGAHQGVVALMLSDYVGSDGRVLAVEASRFNCEVAERNLQANRPNGVTLMHAAVGGENGFVSFVDNGNGYVSRGRSEIVDKVESITIDTLVDRHGPPDVLMLDIEGFEFVALRDGARSALQENIVWLVELHGDATLSAYGGSNLACLSFFDPARFEFHFAKATDADIVFKPLAAVDQIPSERTYLYAFPRSRLVAST